MAESGSDLIEQFINITGSDATAAANMLEAFNDNLEMAINMFLEGHNPEQEEVQEIPPTSDSSDSSDRHEKGDKRAKKARNIDTADSNSQQCMSSDNQNNQNNTPSFADEDEDEVRAPIPQRQEVLVDDQYHAIPLRAPRRVARSVFNACRDFQKESEEYENSLKGKRNLSSRKRRRLHELFQPPVDIIHLGDFQSARDICNMKKKWLLINIQNSVEFACQVLNRDVWSNHIVRDIINANFILWQVSHDSDEGLHYATFYTVKNYPHVSVIDPRTGERLVVWESFGMKPGAEQFAELSTCFLSEHPNLSESFETKDEENIEKDPSQKSVIDLCEEDQMEKAIKESLTKGSDGVFEKEDEDCSDGVEEDIDEHNGENSDNKSSNSENNKISIPESPEITDDSSLSNDKPDDSSSETKVGEKLSSETKVGEKLSSEIKNDICVNGVGSEVVNENEDSSDSTLLCDGEKATIMLRLPNNGRKQISFPLESTLKDLSTELTRLGWPNTSYEIIKAFPRQNLSQLDQQLTLKAAGLHKQETLFVQDR